MNISLDDHGQGIKGGAAGPVGRTMRGSRRSRRLFDVVLLELQCIDGYFNRALEPWMRHLSGRVTALRSAPEQNDNTTPRIIPPESADMHAHHDKHRHSRNIYSGRFMWPDASMGATLRIAPADTESPEAVLRIAPAQTESPVFMTRHPL
jgi:hypothetical protein